MGSFFSLVRVAPVLRCSAECASAIGTSIGLLRPIFFFPSRRRHTRYIGDWSSDVCSSDLIRVAVRRPELVGHLQPAGKVGQIHAVQANVRYPASVEAAMRDSEVAINLVGTLTESGAQTDRKSVE